MNAIAIKLLSIVVVISSVLLLEIQSRAVEQPWEVDDDYASDDYRDHFNSYLHIRQPLTYGRRRMMKALAKSDRKRLGKNLPVQSRTFYENTKREASESR